jgi:hypothetical protein
MKSNSNLLQRFPRGAKSFCRAILASLIAALAASCVPPLPRTMQNLATVMDTMDDREAEFGSIAVSAPILSDPSDAFNFDLQEGPEDFYQDAKNNIQGNESEFEQEMTNLGLSASVSLNPTLAAAYKTQLQQYLTALNKPTPSPSTQPTVTTALDQYLITSLDNAAQQPDPSSKMQLIQSALNEYTALYIASQPAAPKPPGPLLPTAGIPATAQVVVPTTLPAISLPNTAAGQIFNALQSTRSPATPVLTDRTAIITAAGDSFVKGMFQVMGHPELAARFKDKRILFGVCTISVNPGWRTNKNYAANVQVASGYDWETARPDILAQFVADPKVPADLRIRLAIDQDLPIPDDRKAMEVVFKYCPELVQIATSNKTDPIRYWDANIDEYQGFINRDTLSQELHPRIPDNYQMPKGTWETLQPPQVAAVSPLTDTQTLNLSSGYSQQQQVALNMAFALQLAGLNAQASAFLEYAKSLQQNFNTITADVVANSYSDGTTFGFQVGPQFRAIENAKAMQYSGPGSVLDRTSFPGLVVFGFEGADIAPRIRQNDEGKYEVCEPQVELRSEHNWVPIAPHMPRFTEAERLQLDYWLIKDFKKAKNDLDSVNLTDNISARVDQLSVPAAGINLEFNIPETMILPPRKPVVTRLEPTGIELPPPGQEKQVAVTIEGENLDTVEIDKFRLISGGRLIDSGPDAPRRTGDIISAHVILEASDDPQPLIFSLPSAGGGTYTLPLTPFTGSAPEIDGIAPRKLVLNTDANGTEQPTEADILIVGRNLDVIDWRNIRAANSAKIDVLPEAPPSRNVLRVHVSTTQPSGAIAFALPRRDGQGAVYTPPIEIAGTKPSITVRLTNSGTSEDKSTPSGGGSKGAQSQQQPDADHRVVALAGDGQVVLTWWNEKTTASYSIYYRPTNKSDTGVTGTLQGITKSIPITISGLPDGTPYDFTVNAIDAKNQLTPVGSAQATPVKPAPAKSGDEAIKYDNGSQAIVEFSKGVDPNLVKEVVAAATQPSSKSSSSDKTNSNNPGASLEVDTKVVQTPTSKSADTGGAQTTSSNKNSTGN